MKLDTLAVNVVISLVVDDILNRNPTRLLGNPEANKLYNDSRNKLQDIVQDLQKTYEAAPQ